MIHFHNQPFWLSVKMTSLMPPLGTPEQSNAVRYDSSATNSAFAFLSLASHSHKWDGSTLCLLLRSQQVELHCNTVYNVYFTYIGKGKQRKDKYFNSQIWFKHGTWPNLALLSFSSLLIHTVLSGAALCTSTLQAPFKTTFISPLQKMRQSPVKSADSSSQR